MAPRQFPTSHERKTAMGLKKTLKKYNLKSTLLTFLDMIKVKCITKEKYEEEYQINEDIEKREDFSLGDDLETFVANIKQGGLPEESSYVRKFLICLLNTNDRRRLDQKDKEYMETFCNNDLGEADVPKEEWESSESSLKFSQSWCWRSTYLIEWSENSSNDGMNTVQRISTLSTLEGDVFPKKCKYELP